ncbi:MAG: hypothetical protein Q9162_007199, partial [Coniocarpon cinnabarinum]
MIGYVHARAYCTVSTFRSGVTTRIRLRSHDVRNFNAQFRLSRRSLSTKNASNRPKNDNEKPKRGGKRTTVKFGDLPQGLVASSSSTKDADTTPGKEIQKPKLAGKRTTVKFGDLPQGLVAASDFPDASPEDAKPSVGFPTVIQQARDNMLKFPNCIVLTRVGGFYELYFHQAEEWAAQLNLKLARKKTSAGPVPMAGFPFFQLERFLNTLVQDHRVHVAIAEETANDPSQRVKSGGLMFDRQIRRIVTPGTLIDEKFLQPNEHNYLLGIVEAPQADQRRPKTLASDGFIPLSGLGQLSFAWIDLSSGDFMIQVAPASALPSIVARLAPSEIVVDQRLRDSHKGLVSHPLQEYEDRVSWYDYSQNEDKTPAADSDQQASTPVPAKTTSKAARMLVAYVEEQLPGADLQLRTPQSYEETQHMSIDRNTLRGLEILKTLKDGTEKGALLNVVRRTSTRSGARLLAERLVSPSMSLSEIEDRLDLVQEFLVRPDLVDETTALLKRTTDSPRLVQAIAFGKGDAEDLLNLSRTVSLAKNVADIVHHYTNEDSPLRRQIGKFEWEAPTELSKRIQEAIDEEGLMTRYRVRDNDAADAAALAQEAIASEGAADLAALHKRLGAIRSAKSVTSEGSNEDEETTSTDDIWVMRRTASPILAALHDQLFSLRQAVSDLSTKLQTQLGAKSLTLKMTPGLGHIVHVKGKDTKSDFSHIIKEARTVSASKTTRSFYLPSWTSLGARIEDAKLRIRSEEQRIFKSLREGVCANIVPLRRNAAVLDELDVACSSAILAQECNLVRPVLDESRSMQIVDGRHMIVEAGLTSSGRSFTPNDTLIGMPNHRNDVASNANNNRSIHLITGPNMAGKSTYLRQTALISILAQTGLYVPASYARLGLVDAVFSRIGSADNLYQDQSTFMVEMLETAQILKNAGPRSLVVMDEVGRGTTSEDGVA